MGDNEDDLIDEIVNEFITRNLSGFTKSEQFAVANAELHMLRQLFASTYSDPKSAYLELSKRRYISPDLPRLIGEVVIAASHAEDAGGGFLQSKSGGWEKAVRGFSATSNTLLRNLKPHVSEELLSRLRNALEMRHFVVHGYFIGGNGVTNPKTGEPVQFLAVKRSYDSEAPDRKVLTCSEGQLEWLRDEFYEIAGELQDAHNEVLIEQSADEDADPSA